MPTSFWRSPELRDHISRLDRSGFAVEFLRRNTTYRRDYARLQRRLGRRGVDSAAECAAFAQRWGLCFCPCAR
ncbi:hypothetical protein B0W47_15230 [Komagataeibacter nataicola]|uniref:Transcriptional regulator-like domain-containing protein n=3 Tax=Acetobacteraceae TaxID=433 RepID=A0A939HNL7_9PROT|nr:MULTISPECIES: DUF6499 domain-containing protein [Acetobacteraceae]AQU88581.1 hypothetical protein B0W47_15230 [Komagataeibacter nataicola]MBO1325023.1 hypothetical protein [Acetobacter garciniae]MBX0345006.1 hypothetical protein [Acetobacter garciniae]PYD65531.1 hypothetical protein CDI09_13080 [Komagataeibacter nataicola]GBR15403.1 hypothetical protein AA0616_0547 [Komagataeibacter nataicola NRIC 0616]